MYFARRDGVTISEIYRVPTPQLMDKIEEKCTKSKSTDGHVSFSLKQIKEMDPDKVFQYIMYRVPYQDHPTYLLKSLAVMDLHLYNHRHVQYQCGHSLRLYTVL